MNEFDPTNREHINMSALQRFEEDIDIVETYADLYITLSRYVAEEFDIPDHQVHLLLTPDEQLLPSRELFDQNAELGREQARLVLIKLALPLAVYVIEDIEKFTPWITETARAAMNIKGSNHKIETCMKVSHGSMAHSCPSSRECPVKFTSYKLISDAGKFNKSDLEYSESFVDRKIAITLAKIDVAKALMLVDEETAQIITQSYLGRCHSR